MTHGTGKFGLIRIVLMSVLTAMIVSGCLVVSINPWFSKEEVAQTPLIAGIWTDTNKVETASFVAVPDRNGYDLTLVATGETLPHRYQCTLHSLGGELLMQIGPNEEGIPSPGAMLPVYMLFRIELTNTSMRIYPIERKAFESRAKTGQLSIAEIKESSRDEEPVIITSLPEKLKTFINKNLKDKTFFSNKPVYAFTRAGSNTMVEAETIK